MRKSSNTTYDLVNTGLGYLGILQHLGNRSHGRSEVFHAHLLELGTRDRGVEVNSLMKRIDLNERSRGAGKSSLGSLTSSTKTSQSTGILREILSSGFLLELLGEVPVFECWFGVRVFVTSEFVFER